MFVFIYPLHFVFFPISTRYILALIGLICIIYDRRTFNKYLIGVAHFIPVLFFSILTLVVNQTSDIGIGITPIIYTLSFFSVIGVLKVTKAYNRRKFVDLFVAAVTLQMIISLLFFVNPKIEETVNAILVTTDLAQQALEDTEGIRMRGLGAAFFSSGVINCIALLLISLCYTSSRKIYIIAYFIIFIIGIFVARTIVIGLLLSIPLLIKKSKVSLRKIVVWCAAFVGALIVIGSNLKNSDEQKYLNLFNFGFAIINDYESSKKFNTGDIDALSYTGKLPLEIKTWIIGDGLLADPVRPTTAYYKHVDQGYLRSLYYFGLLGTISLLMGYFMEVRKVVKHNRNKWFYLLFLFYTIIMYKGLIDIFQFIIPFYLIHRDDSSMLRPI